MPKKDEKKPTPKVDVALLSDNAFSLWEQIEEITKDGKLSPEEVPVVLKMVADVLGEVSGVLALVPNVDPKVKAILAVIASACARVAVSLEKQEVKIEQAYKMLAEVLEDNKVSLTEVPKLVEGGSNLAEALIAVCLPFIRPEFTAQARALVSFLLKVSGLLTLGKSTASKEPPPTPKKNPSMIPG